MKRRKQLAEIQEWVNREPWASGYLRWLLADIFRLEAALLAAKITAIREGRTGRLLWGLPVNVDEHNAAIDRALECEGE